MPIIIESFIVTGCSVFLALSASSNSAAVAISMDPTNSTLPLNRKSMYSVKKRPTIPAGIMDTAIMARYLV